MRKVAVEVKSAETKDIEISYGTIADIEVNRVIRICNKFRFDINNTNVFVTAQNVEVVIGVEAKNYKKNPNIIQTLYDNLMTGFKETSHSNEVEKYVQYLGRKKLKKFDYELRYTPLTDGVVRITITRI